MNYYVYLLQNTEKAEIYKGFTENLRERLPKHKQSRHGYTAKNGAWELIFYCVFSDKKLALDFEKYLKSGSGRAFIRRHLVK